MTEQDPKSQPGETETSNPISNFFRDLLGGLPWSERAEGTDTFCFDSRLENLLRVHNANGTIRILGSDRNDIEVKAAKRARAESEIAAERLLQAIRVNKSETAGAVDLEVEIPKRWNRRGSANLSIQVPKATSLEIDATNGKVSIEGISGSVNARSRNGSINVTDVNGNVQVQTSNAKVSCCATQGKLIARSCNGKIESKKHRGSIDASTSNGFIRASLEELGEEGVILTTSNGRIVLELPSTANANVDLHVDNGVIKNEWTLSEETRSASDRIRGKLGEGGILIRLRTSNGSITMR